MVAMISTDELEWSRQLFGGSDLGDARRTDRLVDVAARMVSQMGHSLAKSCEGDRAALLSGYRLMRNEAVELEAIRASGFEYVAQKSQIHRLLLAVEDSTSITYPHAVAAELGLTSSNQDAKRSGFVVHSVLLLDAISEQTFGLIEQQHWCRERGSFGKKHLRKRRAYEDKESYKWEQASVQTAKRLGLAMERSSPALWCYTVQIPRKAREAKLLLRSMTLELLAPAGRTISPGSLKMNVVMAEEIDAATQSEPLH